jgi:hypothetical protein
MRTTADIDRVAETLPSVCVTGVIGVIRIPPQFREPARHSTANALTTTDANPTGANRILREDPHDVMIASARSWPAPP